MKNYLYLLTFLTIYSLSAWSSPLYGILPQTIEEIVVTRIENISIPEELEGSNTVIIGHRYWQKMDLEKTVLPLPKQLNNLIRYYHYESNFEDKEYQGEVFLRIYYLKDEESKKVDREKLYKEISESFFNLNDSIISWKETDVFKPFPAFEYTFLGFITQEKDSSYKSHNLNLKVILANERAYFFIFLSKETEDINMFNKSCLSIIKDIDIASFYQKEKQEEKVKKQEEEERNERSKRSKRNLQEGSIVLICGIFVFVVASWNIRRNNKYAMRWAIYTCILFSIGLIAMVLDLLIRSSHEDTQVWLWLCYVPSTILDSVIVWYLKKCSSYEYQEYYLIPKLLLRNPFFGLNNNYKKRIFMIGLIYPFFILTPIPVVGLVLLVCYIIPISLFFIATQGIINLMSWVKEGKALDNKSKNS